MRNKPRIRFKGFTEDWEQRKLGDLLILLKDGSHGTHKNTDVGVYLLSAKNIKNGQINIMPDDRIISWEDYDVIHKNYELQFGDILLTIVGSIGETAIYNLKTKVTFQRSVAFLRPSSDLNNGFLYTLINTNRFQNQLQTKQVVSAQPGIYLGDLASIDITYPKNLSEQEKIYSIFKEIENFITLHQRKLEKLKLAKKALLQKLFPKNGSQFPEIRFKGFTDAWEQRKLGAMCSLFTDGDWIESKDQSNEGIRLIQTGNIGVGKFIDKPENKKWISHSTFDNLRCKELLDGDILISRLPHPAGRACIVSTNNEKWITAVDCTIVRLLDRYSNKFILQSLCTYNYFHLIDSFLAGGTRQRVSRSNLSDINIMSPEKIEQDKIGLFFECIDNLITLHQCKLDKLQDVKKGLLQKMFV